METKVYSTYEEAASDYLAMFKALREAPPAPAEVTTRGAGDVPADILIDRADNIADVSTSMLPLARVYLDSPDFNQREGFSVHLLSQAAAELQIASELLVIVQEGKTETPGSSEDRSNRGAVLHEAIDSLVKSMEVPIPQGISPYVIKRSGVTSLTIDQAKSELPKQAMIITQSISTRVLEFGGGVASNLIFNTEWSAVISGSGLLGKEIKEKLNSIKAGLGVLLAKAVATAAKLLLNVYDKIIALLGKDKESEIRKKIQEWLEKIKKEGKIDLFESLVNKFYNLDSFKTDLAGWMEKTQASKEVIDNITEEVSNLGNKFALLIKRMEMVATVIGFAKKIQLPQVLFIAAGIQVGLLGVVVYSGYEYIGFIKVPLPSFTKGVAQVIKEKLLPGK